MWWGEAEGRVGKVRRERKIKVKEILELEEGWEKRLVVIKLIKGRGTEE